MCLIQQYFDVSTSASFCDAHTFVAVHVYLGPRCQIIHVAVRGQSCNHDVRWITSLVLARVHALAHEWPTSDVSFTLSAV